MFSLLYITYESRINEKFTCYRCARHRHWESSRNVRETRRETKLCRCWPAWLVGFRRRQPPLWRSFSPALSASCRVRISPRTPGVTSNAGKALTTLSVLSMCVENFHHLLPNNSHGNRVMATGFRRINNRHVALVYFLQSLCPQLVFAMAYACHIHFTRLIQINLRLLSHAIIINVSSRALFNINYSVVNTWQWNL